MVASFRACLVVALCSIMTAPTSADFLGDMKAKVTNMFAGAKDAAEQKAKRTACAKPINSGMTELKKVLGTGVKDECKPMKEKSDAAHTCCMGKGKEMQSTIVKDNKKAQMTKCMGIAKVSDIPTEMLAAVKEGKKKTQADLKAKLTSLKSCATAVKKDTEKKVKKAVADKAEEATDAVEEATDSVEEAMDSDTGTDAEEATDTEMGTDTEEATDDGEETSEDEAATDETEEKFELNGPVSPSAGFPLPGVAALVLGGFVASVVVFTRWRRHGVRGMEIALESDAESPPLE